MAHGSEDYWMSSSRFLANTIYAVKNALIEGSGLLAKLDSLDGTMGGVITLADLNSGQCEMLAKLLGIETSVLTGGDLLNKLDALDGTMDGRLTVAELTSVQADLLAKLTGIDASLLAGSDLLNKLDALDGTMDGKLTVAELTSVQANLLAELIGIDASLLTGGDLLNKLDALDGTMDGKLDITQLNESSVKTNLDTAITRFNTIITELGTQISKLTDIVKYTHPKSTHQAETWQIPPQQTIQFAGSWAGRLNMRIRGHIDNPQIIYIGYTTPVHDGRYEYTLSAGEIIDDNHTGTYFARVYDGTVIIYTQDAG